MNRNTSGQVIHHGPHPTNAAFVWKKDDILINYDDPHNIDIKFVCKVFEDSVLVSSDPDDSNLDTLKLDELKKYTNVSLLKRNIGELSWSF